MARVTGIALPFLAGLVWIGCTSRAPSGGTTDSDAGDASVSEVSAETGTDAAQPDAAQPDAAQPDATAPDVTTPDVTTPDVTTPDATTPDVTAPDVTAPDVTAPDVTAPDVTAPDVTTPDATAPDVSRPDVTTPDAPPVDASVDVPLDRVDAALDAAQDVAVDARPDATDAGTCTPSPETCDGRDNDCDGIVDESGCSPHLLLSEVVVGPNEAEFIEVHNPTSAPVDLSNYYVSDLHDYACNVGRTCTIAGRTVATTGTSDFVARFPMGATIPARGYVVVATASPERFAGIHGGRCPDFYLPSSSNLGDAGAAPLGPCTRALAMRSAQAMTSTIGSSAGLTNGGEPVVLFRWDGASNLVEDVDYVFYGDATTANAVVDKSATSVMGMMYRADTPAAMQRRAAAPGNGASAVRCDYAETGERRTGGNGLGGHDETSEPMTTTWRTTAAPVVPDGGMIMRANATPGADNDCR